MNTPADTWNYFYAGYAVIFLVMGSYIASLIIRWRRLVKEKDFLKQNQPG